MKTLSYIYGTEQEIEKGAELYFGQLLDGEEDGEGLLNDGSICVGQDENDMPVIVSFEIIEQNDDILKTNVKVTDIY